MGETVINQKNARGRYSIPAAMSAVQKNVEIDLKNNDATQYAVITKDLDPGAPATYKPINLPPKYKGKEITIHWFAAFGIRENNTARNFAKIKYAVYLDPLPEGSGLFVYYGGQVHEQAFTTSGNKIWFELEVGDPPIGYGP